MTPVEQALQAVKDVYINYPKRYDQTIEELKKVESELQDVLHVIELCSLDAIGIVKIYKELRKLRGRRRELKDELKILSEIKSFSTKQKPNRNQIDEVINSVQTILVKREKRTYKMRVRKDLQELIK